MALAFDAALALRNEIIALGWARDLIAVESWGQHVGNGTPPKGYRVVLAWADGRLRRIHSLDEARVFLPAATTRHVGPSEALHAMPTAGPVLSRAS